MVAVATKRKLQEVFFSPSLLLFFHNAHFLLLPRHHFIVVLTSAYMANTQTLNQPKKGKKVKFWASEYSRANYASLQVHSKTGETIVFNEDTHAYLFRSGNALKPHQITI